MADGRWQMANDRGRIVVARRWPQVWRPLISSALICWSLRWSVCFFSYRILPISGVGFMVDSAYCWIFRSTISSISPIRLSGVIEAFRLVAHWLGSWTPGSSDPTPTSTHLLESILQQMPGHGLRLFLTLHTLLWRGFSCLRRGFSGGLCPADFGFGPYLGTGELGFGFCGCLLYDFPGWFSGHCF